MMPLRFFADPALLRRALHDLFSGIDHTSRRSMIRALAVVVLSALLLSLSPIYAAKVIDTLAAQGRPASHRLVMDVFLYLGFRFAGQACVDLRWRLIHPLLYTLSYAVCTLTAGRLSGIVRPPGQPRDQARVIAEQVAVMSKMELGSISLLYGVLAVMVPTAIELVIVCTALGVVMGPWLVLYMAMGGTLFMIAVSFKREQELTAAEAANQADNRASASFAEYLAHPSLVREFSADHFMKSRLAHAIAVSVSQHHWLFSIKTERGLYLTALTGMIYSVVLCWIVLHATSATISGGSLFLLIVYLDRILQPLTNASVAVNNIQNGLISMKGAYTLLQDLQTQAAQVCFKVGLERAWEKISLSPGRHFLSTDQTLMIGKGAWIRVQGPSGSGKSTYLRRLYYQLLAEAAYSGKDIHYLNPTPLIVRGSVFDNMALGDLSMTREKVQAYWTAWHRTFGNRLIALDTDVEQLSAGESQFLAICRTLLRKPEIVIFDEATNSIDGASEPHVWQMVKAALPDATVFVVSHRDVSALAFDHEERLGVTSASDPVIQRDLKYPSV